MSLLSYGLSRSKNAPDENPYKIGDVLTVQGEKHKMIGFCKTPDLIKVESLVDGNPILILWYQSDELLERNIG